MITHAENLYSSGYGNTRRYTYRTEGGNHGEDDEDSGSPSPTRQDWRTDLAAHVPYGKYMRMTQEERDERAVAKYVAREARQARGRNRCAGRGNSANSTTGTTRQVITAATVVSSTPDSTPNTVAASAP